MKLFQKFILVFFFILFFAAIVFYAKGYRVDFKKKTIEPTGIIAVSSFPKASSVYLNGKLVGATDINLNLKPGKWLVEVKKDGYTSWQKEVNLKEGVVISLNARLFPKNPSLKPLTSIGVAKAVRIDNLDKVLLFVQKGKDTDGVYLFEKSKNPIASKEKPKKLFYFSRYSSGKVEVESLIPIFSPDFRQFILEFNKKQYLFSLNPEKEEVLEVTSSYDQLIAAWKKEEQERKLDILKSFPRDFEKIASSSFEIISFSPDETKLLYRPKRSFELPMFLSRPLSGSNPTPQARDLKKGKLYVYDRKEDRNYLINFQMKTEPLWYIDSKRLIFIKDSSIVVVDYDGKNERTVYSGPFEKDFLVVTSDGNLLILLNLNKKLNPYPDIYELIINS